MRLEFFGTATLLIVLVAPVLNVAIAAVALSLGGTEGQSLVSRLVCGVEVVNDGNNEGLGPATVGSCQSTSVNKLTIDPDTDAIEVDISQELERSNMTFTHRYSRYVNMYLALDPVMKLVVVLRP